MKMRMKMRMKIKNGMALPITLFLLMGLLLAFGLLIKSSETSMIVAGNIGIKSQLNYSNTEATSYAYDWLSKNTTTLNNDNKNAGYFSNQELNINYLDPSVWEQAYSYNNGDLDKYGNTSQYIIRRMCSLPNTTYDEINNVCSRGAVEINTSGISSFGYDAIAFNNSTETAVYYKIIVRTCYNKCPGQEDYEQIKKNGLLVTETIVKL